MRFRLLQATTGIDWQVYSSVRTISIKIVIYCRSTDVMMVLQNSQPMSSGLSSLLYLRVGVCRRNRSGRSVQRRFLISRSGLLTVLWGMVIFLLIPSLIPTIFPHQDGFLEA